MSGLPLRLPTIQNWNCHNCGGCCRQHAIEVTDEERQRIVEQHWEKDEAIGEQPVFEWHAGPPWRKRWRLAHQPDGACVFLDEKGLCRIHAKHGEDAKPLACRVYPYAFHPSGRQVTVSLRFSCPSVVGNAGKAIDRQSPEIRKIARQVVPEHAREVSPPRVSAKEKVDWPDLLLFAAALDDSMADRTAPVAVRLQRALFWLNLVEEAHFEQVSGERLREFLSLIREAATAQFPGDDSDPQDAAAPPSRLALTQFRLMVAQYSRRDTLADLQSGWSGRWKLLRAATRFARGRGTIPPLQDCFAEVPFDALEQPFGPLPEESQELFERYFRVKIQGLHFCGPAFYGVPLVEGFRALALMYPVVLWLARWLAVSNNRTTWHHEDIARAMTIADHHHGYSPALGHGTARRRVRLLAQMDEIRRLCDWYGR